MCELTLEAAGIPRDDAVHQQVRAAALNLGCTAEDADYAVVVADAQLAIGRSAAWAIAQGRAYAVAAVGGRT
jgi:hypothetical protein